MSPEKLFSRTWNLTVSYSSPPKKPRTTRRAPSRKFGCPLKRTREKSASLTWVSRSTRRNREPLWVT